MSSPESAYPPGWKKPSDVLLMMKKRKKALDARLNINPQSNIGFKPEKTKKSGNERYNPFRKNGTKVESKIPVEFDESADGTLFQLLKSSAQITTQQPVQIKIPKITKPETKTKQIEVQWDDNPKVDWSLKTKLRILSPRPFSWNSGTLKTSEEASGTTGFVRCLHSNESLDSSPSADLHRRCLVWVHPSIPWINLFPRYVTKSSIVNNSFSNSDPKIRHELYIDWCDSVRSLFQLVRACQCPYFYICAHSFTVVFRAAGIAGISECHAMISPTTKGMRQALSHEEISFSRPLIKKRHSSSDSGIGTDSESSQEFNKTNTSNDIDFDNNEDGDDDVSSWMNSIGLNESILTGTSAQRKLSHRESAASDSRADSLIYITGGDVHALYNFILNSETICIAQTGPLAGIPPTLIAPNAFQGATLRPLRVKHGIVQQGHQKMHSLLLEGPILPHVPLSLIQLLQSNNNDESYTMSMSTLDSTSPFSTSMASSTFTSSAFANQNLTDCGLHPRIVGYLCCEVETSVVKEVVCKDGKFRCS